MPITPLMSTTPVSRRLSILLAPLLLGACGMFSATPETAPACPRVAILPDAADLVRYRPGSGTDITDMVVEARMTGVTGGCRRGRGDSVEVVMRIGIAATRGPQATGRSEQLPYFVAVSNAQGQIIDKAVFATTVEFPANVSRRQGVDEQRLVIPAGMDPAGLRVDVGFQLTPEELALNRRRARR